MYGLYLDAYVAFLSLIMLLLLALNVLPKSGRKPITKKDFKPKVLVILPCKGSDIDLVSNLKAAHNQTYKNYDLIAVIDSKNDPSFKAIKATNTNFMISNIKSEGSGKVRAIASAIKSHTGYKAYVILDSDALVNRTWLENLVSGLGDRHYGISTAFPVFEPKGNSFWAKVKHTWGYVGFGLMESERTRFGWGGSLAFRSDLLKGKNFNYFANSISDDIAITNIAKAERLKIAYIPEASPTVYCNDSFDQFTEWSNRQTAFSISGNTRIMYYGILFYSASILLLLSGIMLAILVNALFLIFLLPFAIGAIKAYRRSNGSLHVLLIYPIMNFVYLFNLLRARGIRTVIWRGKTYDITKIRKTEMKRD